MSVNIPAPKSVSWKVDDASSAEDWGESAPQVPEEVSPLVMPYDTNILEDDDRYQVCWGHFFSMINCRKRSADIHSQANTGKRYSTSRFHLQSRPIVVSRALLLSGAEAAEVQSARKHMETENHDQEKKHDAAG